VRRDPESIVAREIRRRRDQRGFTAQDLAARIAKDGGKLSRQAISKIENGDRGVSIQELLLLGKALGVPPALLLFPLGREATVEVLPGHDAATWQVWRWFAGLDVFPGSVRDDPEDIRAFQAGSQPVTMYLEHDRYTALWRAMRIDAANNLSMAEAAVSDAARANFLAEADRAAAEAHQIERELVRHRQYMRRHGVEPEPLLDEGLAHLDDDLFGALPTSASTLQNPARRRTQDDG
jgi:transcriptional regulator with XRE-family HTH domain